MTLDELLDTLLQLHPSARSAFVRVTKRWWARVVRNSGYGDWHPTGCTDLSAAVDYLQTYYGCVAKEWLQL